MQPQDEETIRASVEARDEVLLVRRSFVGPGARRRRLPLWQCCIENGYLRVAREVLGHSRQRVEQNARQQLLAWKEREVHERVAEAKRDIDYRAIRDTEVAEAEIATVRRCLAAGLAVEPDLPDWSALCEAPHFVEQEFDWCQPLPVRPERRWLERIWRPGYTRRLLAYERAMQALKDDKARQKAAHEEAEAERRGLFEDAVGRLQACVEGVRQGLAADEPTALVELLGAYFECEAYPVRLTPFHRAHWVAADEAVVVDVVVPAPDEVSKIAGYKAQERYMRVAPVMLKQAEHAALYDEGVRQLALRTLHGVFAAARADFVQAAVVNVFTSFQDPDSEQDTTVCLLSVQTEREELAALKLDEQDAGECLEGLSARCEDSLAELVPVRPILTVTHDVEELRGVGVRDFEQRVRDALARTFPGEAVELLVETSRSGEVEGVVIDPDPVRGGTFVIRALRSQEPVPVAAVRDLHAALREQGAATGLFFSTSRFDAEARAFARGRRLLLVDAESWACLVDRHGADAQSRTGSPS